MTFLELQEFVLFDRFGETRRAAVKAAINARYGRIWAMDDWTFKKALVTLNVSQGASSVSLGTLRNILALKDSTTSPGYSAMDALRPEDYYDWATRTSGTPGGFTVIGDTLYLDAPAASARTLQVVGELKFVELVNDADEPLLPEEFHQVIGHGATSDELRRENDESWKGAYEDYKSGIEDMRRGYLTSVRIYDDRYPAWP